MIVAARAALAARGAAAEPAPSCARHAEAADPGAVREHEARTAPSSEDVGVTPPPSGRAAESGFVTFGPRTPPPRRSSRPRPEERHAVLPRADDGFETYVAPPPPRPPEAAPPPPPPARAGAGTRARARARAGRRAGRRARADGDAAGAVRGLPGRRRAARAPQPVPAASSPGGRGRRGRRLPDRRLGRRRHRPAASRRSAENAAMQLEAARRLDARRRRCPPCPGSRSTARPATRHPRAAAPSCSARPTTPTTRRCCRPALLQAAGDVPRGAHPGRARARTSSRPIATATSRSRASTSR